MMKKIKTADKLLLTPGPLSTTGTVKHAMMRDMSTWDADYNRIVTKIRKKLVELATAKTGLYTAVLMQGSGTFAIESVLGSVIPEEGKLLVVSNGVYGRRMAKIASVLKINFVEYEAEETGQPSLNRIEEILQGDQGITHVAVVHIETTTGMINPLTIISKIVKKYNKIFIVDAMSSFGGIPIDIFNMQIDFLITSSNKCIQGVPGFGIIIALKDELEKCGGRARSHSLDLYDQWETMENDSGKWRFTSPTHTVLAFQKALCELEKEGGVEARYIRYRENHDLLVEGMKKLKFKTVIPENIQSPVITSFHYPKSGKFNFEKFYKKLKDRGFVIYPGKLGKMDTFRIANIGNIKKKDIKNLLKAVGKSVFW
jgi:2-aminoethylphosphonate-pyruvate transaminase